MNRTAQSSTQKGTGADVDISTGPSVIVNLSIIPAAVDSLLTIKHGSTGNIAWQLWAKANSSSLDVPFPLGLSMPQGIRYTLSGVGAVCHIAYL